MSRIYRSAAVAISMVLGVGAALPQGASAQGGVYAYPLGGQSQQQEQKDNSECHRWSVQRTGFDPNNPPVQVAQRGYSSPPPSKSGGFFGNRTYGQGGGVSDAGRGAAVGALGGAIAGNAGKGAAIGALSGLFVGGIKRANRSHEQEQWKQQQQAQMQQQQAQADATYQRGTQEYRRAFSACMEGKNYRVR